MKTMKYFMMAAFVCLLAACSNAIDNPVVIPVEPEEEEGPTQKEKAMIPSEMMWQLDSILVINNPGTAIETYRMLYAGQDTYQWTYSFYPYTYKFPEDLVFYSEWDDEAYVISDRYAEDYCKYTCSFGGDIVSAGYLCYYRDKFTFRGLSRGAWVEFMIREADTQWDSDVWTCAYNSSEDPDGTVLERTIEYYSRVRESGERGGASITIDGTKFSVSHANWKADVLNGNDTFYTLQVANSANFADVDPYDVVSIVYKVANGNVNELATGEFSDFEVSVTRLSANEANDRTFYAFGSDDNVKLYVVKNGSGYQIKLDAMKYTTDGGAASPTYDGSAFSYAGPVAKGLSIQ